MMPTVRNVKSLSSVVVMETRTTLMTRDHVKTLAEKTDELLKLNQLRPADLVL